LHEIGEIDAFLREGNPAFADRWLAGLFKVIATLNTLPNRGRIAPESPQDGHVVRQVLHRQYRVFYVVYPDGEVLITHVQHSALAAPYDE
jgi:plasmid stabilization system protein ParE